MGKIIFNGKSRSTPYGWHGKTVSKFIFGGKVCTLGAATPPPPLHPSIEPPGAITFSNGFAYLGKWPAAADMRTALTYLSTTTDTTLALPAVTTNAILRYMAIPWVKTLPSNFDHFSVDTLYAPELVTVGDFVFDFSFTTTIEAPKLKTAGMRFLARYLGTSVSLPALETFGTSSFSETTTLTSVDMPSLTSIPVGCFTQAPLTHISMPKLNTFDHHARTIFPKIVNAATTTVTLPSKFNIPSEKDKLFGAGNWYQITFTWV